MIISARPVPGNELRVHDTINQLLEARGRGPARGERCRARLRACQPGGDPHALRSRPAQGGDADSRRVPDAGGERAAGAGCGVPASSIVLAENGSVVELGPAGAAIVDRVEAGVTFVDGLGVGDIGDVALRDRRHMAEDGVLIIVATLASQNGVASARRRADRPRVRRERAADRRDARRGGERAARTASRDDVRRDQAAPGAPARRCGPAGLRPDEAAADDPAGRRRGVRSRESLDGWAGMLAGNAAEHSTARRLIAQLAACEVAALVVLPAARALGAWRCRVRPRPGGGRPRSAGPQSVPRPRLPGSSGPLGRYLLELEPERAEGRSWYGEPGRGRAARLAGGAWNVPASRSRRCAWRRRTSSWPCSSGRWRGSPRRR